MLTSQSSDRRNLIRNIISLGLIQGSNYLLPLLTVPYLVRVLGVSNYGVLAFVTATVALLVLVTDFGFNLTATRRVAESRQSTSELNKIFSSVMIIKSIITILMAVFMLTVCLVFEKFSVHWFLHMCAFTMVIGQLVFPVWFFQGIEEMHYVTFVNVGSRILFTIGVFALVKTPQQIFLVPLLTGIGAVLGGIFALVIAYRRFNVRWELATVSYMASLAKESSYVFFSNLSTSVFTIFTTIILSVFSSDYVVGLFAAAEKLIQAVKSLIIPFSQAVYPQISRKIRQDREIGKAYAIRFMLKVSVGMLLASLGLFFASEEIVLLLLGPAYLDSQIYLKILSPIPFVVVFNNLFGTQLMLNLGYNSYFFRILFSISVASLVSAFIFTPIYFGYASAWVMLMSELLVTISMLSFLIIKKEINLGRKITD